MNYLEKYYRVYAGVDLDAILHNIKMLKANLNETAKVTAVIKADGYGHGAVPIAKAIDNLVSSYAVATIYEALNLKKHHITKPIFIIGYTHDSMFGEAIAHDIRLTVYEEQTAQRINQVAKSLGKTAKIHIKLDTGMSRIGFKDNQDAVNCIQRISVLEHLQIEGIFTHFCASDSKNKDSANTQLNRFTNFNAKLKENGIHIPVIHCANSACIIDLPNTSFDTVRAGIALYGLYPSDEVNKDNVLLQQAISLKSHIIQIKSVEPNTGIGYGSTFITNRETIVATIPVGYGDGYPRNLSNKGYVTIKGQKAPIIGRVCMDQFMVDITDLKEIENGDVVTLLGQDGDQMITVEELAALAGTFNYEFVCDLGKRIPRVYFKNQEVVCEKDYYYDLYEVKNF